MAEKPGGENEKAQHKPNSENKEIGFFNDLQYNS